MTKASTKKAMAVARREEAIKVKRRDNQRMDAVNAMVKATLKLKVEGELQRMELEREARMLQMREALAMHIDGVIRRMLVTFTKRLDRMIGDDITEE